jgi:hypothetical protein
MVKMRPVLAPFSYRPLPETTAPKPTEKTSSLQHDADNVPCGHHNCILVFGPDVPLPLIANAERECADRGFSAETFYTAGLQSLEDLRLQLHAGTKLGKDTQIFFVFHGGKNDQGRHMLTMTSHAQQEGLVPTVETLRGLRRSGDAETPLGECKLWGGTMHLITCEGGELEQEILPQDAAWQEGNYLIYAGKDRLLVNEGMRAMTYTFEYLAQCQNQGTAPDPRQMLAYAAYRAGDGVTLLGASVEAAVVVKAPALTPENMLQFHAGEWLKFRVHEGLETRQAFDGLQVGKEDAKAVLSAMSALAGAPAGQQANLYENKLRNVLISAIGHQDADTVSLLLAENPHLAEIRILTGETAEELAWRDGNPIIIDAVIGARLAFLGPRPLLLQSCARGDHRTALKLLAMAPRDAFSKEDLALGMELARENKTYTYRFFEGLLEAAELDENHLARVCLRVALERETLPSELADRWKNREEASPQQRLDDARLFKVDRTNASQAPSALVKACREGDVMLLDMLLQRFGLASVSQAGREQLAHLALGRENGSELLSRLLDNALLHGDVAMFRTAWNLTGGQRFIQMHGRLLLEQACLGNRLKVAQYLLQTLDITKDPEAHGDTPLHLTASGDSRDVLEWLLTMQPALDQVNKQGDTALHIACRMGHEDIARQLLAAGAATGIRNTGGETALDVAQGECSADTIALLGQARH